jgi:hypothetical protein
MSVWTGRPDRSTSASLPGQAERKGWPAHDSKERTGGIREQRAGDKSTGAGSWNRTTGTGQPEKTIGIVQPGRETEDRTATT